MPVYEYRCSKCGAEFEQMRRMSESSEPAPCPQCGAQAERIISTFASKVGFYVRASAKPAFRKPASRDDRPATEAKE